MASGWSALGNQLANGRTERELQNAAQRLALQHTPDFLRKGSPAADYDGKPELRAAYLRLYAGVHCQAAQTGLEDLLREGRWAPRPGPTTVCCLGGGPGSEALGVLRALGQPSGSVVANFDRAAGWADVFRRALSGVAMTVFHSCDLLAAPVDPRLINSVKQADIITMVKFAKIDGIAVPLTRLLKEVFWNMRPGTLFYYIDGAGDRKFRVLCRMTERMGLEAVLGPRRMLFRAAECDSITVQSGPTRWFLRKAIWVKKLQLYPGPPRMINSYNLGAFVRKLPLNSETRRPTLQVDRRNTTRLKETPSYTNVGHQNLPSYVHVKQPSLQKEAKQPTSPSNSTLFHNFDDTNDYKNQRDLQDLLDDELLRPSMEEDPLWSDDWLLRVSSDEEDDEKSSERTLHKSDRWDAQSQEEVVYDEKKFGNLVVNAKMLETLLLDDSWWDEHLYDDIYEDDYILTFPSSDNEEEQPTVADQLLDDEDRKLLMPCDDEPEEIRRYNDLHLYDDLDCT